MNNLFSRVSHVLRSLLSIGKSGSPQLSAVFLALALALPALVMTTVQAEAAPQVELSGSGLAILPGDTTPSTADGTDFGTVFEPGGGANSTFVIRNTGTTTLTLAATPITFSGANAADFSVSVSPATTLAPSGIATFIIAFNPTALGARSATMTIHSNDPVNGTYTVALQGNGIAPPPPVMSVQGNGITIANGDTTPAVADGTDLGTVAIGATAGAQFRIYNTGGSTLTLGAISFIGAGAGDYLVFSAPNSPIVAGGNTSFTIAYIPSTAGPNTVTLQIDNDDPARSPYTFTLTGTGLATPEINVTGAGRDISDGDTSPSTLDGTYFGQTTIGNTLTKQFVIENLGTGPLTLGANAVSFTGTGAGDFSITTQPPSTIAVGSSATITVTYTPSVAALTSATLVINNDDANESPYNFLISGTGLAPQPEINVRGNGVNIVDGDTSTSTFDGTNFGSANIGNTLTKQFVIENTGTGPLTLGANAVSFTGTGAGDFSITTQPPSSIAAGSSATITVTYTPSTTGASTATLVINNDDANENPYNFAITGTGLAPEPDINVRGNGISIANGDTSPSTLDGTDFGSVVIGNSVTHQFVIENPGTAPLTLGAGSITFIGGSTGDYTLLAQPPASVAAGSSTTISVVYTPSTVGANSANIAISNNVPFKSFYNFALTGTGASASAPEINVTGNGVTILDGDTTPSIADSTDFGNVNVGSSSTQLFLIQNTGTAALNLGANAVSFIGAGAGDYSVVSQPPVAIAAGSSYAISVTFVPSTAGANTVTLQINNDDANESPYNFAITGTGVAVTAPEINVSGTGTGADIADGDTTPGDLTATNFGGVSVGSNAARIFVIENLGDAPLILGPNAVSFLGAGASNFSVATQPPSTIAAGGSNSFLVTYTPSSVGVHTVTLQINNNDANESPYDFLITGTGIGVPEINVTGNGIGILDGDFSPTASDGTNFGSVNIGSTVTQQFVIENLGAATLTLNANAVSITGTGAGDYSIVAQPPTTIAGNSSTTITVSYTPSSTGANTVTLQINNDDTNESPYNFYITGTGVAPAAPEIDVFGNNIAILAGDTTPSLADGTDFGDVFEPGGTATQVFEIRNTGTATLNLTAPVQISGTNGAEFTIVSAPATTVAPGASTSVTVEFNPWNVSLHTVTMTIISDDADEGTYAIALQGNGIAGAPQINVTGNGITILHDDITPSLADGTNFGDLLVADGTTDKTFLIENLGNVPLDISSILIGGTNPGAFSVVSPASLPLSIPAGGSQPLTIRFDASSGPGVRSAIITIGNNDNNRTNYRFTISGRGLAPVIGLNFMGSSIAYLTDSVLHSSIPTGDTANQIYTITNNGNTVLNLSGVTLTPGGPFSISVDPAATVAPGDSTSFIVGFSPTLAGTVFTDVNIASDDPTYPNFSFKLRGFGWNTAPVANPGPNQTVASGALVTLDASGSTDVDGTIVAYEWTYFGGTIGAPVLSSYTAVNPTFTAPTLLPGSSPRNLTFDLVVTDNLGLASVTRSVTITVNPPNQAPTADAGANQTVASGATVTLDGTGSSDPDGSIASYQWTRNGGTGAAVTLSSTTAASPTFTAQTLVAGDPAVTYVFDLVVTDNLGLASAARSVTITVNPPNQAPTANAGTAQTVASGATVTLDGTGSSDPDGTIASYQWARNGGTGAAVTLSSTTAASPTFTAQTLVAGDPAVTYVFDLVVTDDLGAASVASSVTITVNPPANQAPTANAGPAQTVASGATVTLDGTGSTDPDGTIASYQWTRNGGTGAAVTLSSTTAASPTFTAQTLTPADAAVTYVFDLVVTDDLGAASVASSVTITVNPPANQAPTANAGPAQTVASGATVTLDGTGSTDPDGTIASYQWTRNGGTGAAVTLSSTTAASPTFTAQTLAPGAAPVTYVFDLVVTDNLGAASVVNSVTITVREQATVTITGLPTTLTGTTGFVATITFSAPVTGFQLADLQITGGTVANLAGGPSVYTVDVTPAAVGDLTLQVPAAVAVDAAGLGNLPAATTVVRAPTTAVQTTSGMIADFMQTRASTIVANTPDTIRFLDETARRPVENISLEANESGYTLAFKGSLMARNPEDSRVGAFEVWADISGAGVTTPAYNSAYFLGYLGAHKFIKQDLLVGMMVQLDYATQADLLDTMSVEGWGYMVGPYVAGKINNTNLSYEAQLRWGRSFNTISPTGTFTDSFDTERWLARAKIRGDFQTGDWTIAPNLSLSYFAETQSAYTDGNGLLIPSQTITLGEVSFGPEFSRGFAFDNGNTLTTMFGFSAITNFAVSDNGSQSFPLLAGEWRSRVNTALAFTTASGWGVNFEGYYDGIGQAGYEALGASLDVVYEF